jgi:alpha-L-rhamnosidase
MEAWSEALKPNVSCAHPWAASPLFLVVEDFLGIRPLEPGFRSFSVDPRVPSRLSSLGATVPTVAGDISVDVERDGEDRRLRVVVPPGASCRVSLPGGGRTLTDGEHTFTW